MMHDTYKYKFRFLNKLCLYILIKYIFIDKNIIKNFVSVFNMSFETKKKRKPMAILREIS